MKGHSDILQELRTNKEADLSTAVRWILEAGQAPEEILDGLVSEEEVYRYNCYQVLVRGSEMCPQILYPEWDRLARLLDSNNAYHRSVAVHLLANLTPVDSQGKFEAIFDRYFALLDDAKILVTRYLVQNTGTIARAKPALRARIVERLLHIDEAQHKHKDLIKGDAIESFDAFFEEIENQEEIASFVRAQLDCSSPKTRKIAKRFLEKWEGRR
jgi:hypothetical protein